MLIREDVDSTAVIRFEHGKVSALDAEFCHALIEELNNVAASQSRALVLTGSGSTFSAGVDLFRVLEGGAAYLENFLPRMEAFFRTLLTFPKPVVAAINGHAIAGGCIIAAGCDVRLMVDGKGRIGVPELLVGVPFPALPFEMMRARLAPTHFKQLVLSGKTVTAADALSIGLIDEATTSDAMIPRALHAAELLAQIPPIAFALTKQLFVGPVLESVGKARSLNDAAVAAWAHPDVQARMRAYVAQTVGKK